MWFDSRQQALARHGEVLQARSALLRAALAQDSRALQVPLALTDQVLAGGRWLKAHPEWVGVGVAVLVLWRPRRAWRLGRRLWSGWRLWRRAQRWQAIALALRLRR